MNVRNRFFLFFAILLLTSLACSVGGAKATPTALKKTPTVAKGTPAPTLAPTAVVKTLEGQYKSQMLTATAGGPITFTITEDQMTVLLIDALKRQDQLQVTNPQVRFENNQCELTGKIQSGKTGVDGKIIFRPNLTAQGYLQIVLVSAEVGGVPLPAALIQSLTSEAEKALNNYISQSSGGMRIESISIADGKMSIKGKKP